MLHHATRPSPERLLFFLPIPKFWRRILQYEDKAETTYTDTYPQMIEKHSATQSSALSDLQSELRSLKTLLVSRQQNLQPPSATPPNGNGTLSTPTQTAADALLRKGKSSIPAWQMGPSSASGGNTSSSSSPSGSLSSSAVLEPEKEGQ